jgi:hypothetical protein
MLDSKTFRFVEMFTRSDLEVHPVWRHYDESRDRSLILAWGVGGERLDREVAKFKFCGPHPLYPVLQLDPLPDGSDMNIRVQLVTSNDCRLDGYVIDPHAVGVFAADREFCFNRNLPGAAGRQAAKLAAALGATVEELFPLSYRADFVRADGSAIEGKLGRYW